MSPELIGRRRKSRGPVMDPDQQGQAGFFNWPCFMRIFGKKITRSTF
jgi:hypothetical protein